VLRMLQCLCCVWYYIFGKYCTLLCCTTNQCALYVPLWCVCYVLGLSLTTHKENIYILITSACAYHIALLAEFMRELGVIDFCCDAIIMKQDVLFCMLVGFWHLCHKL